jgi:transcriptional regulator with XRE-family HTH domain
LWRLEMANGNGIGDRLKRLRIAKGLGPVALSKAAGVARTALHRIEFGRTRNPSAPVLMRLADALGVTTDELLGAAELSEAALEASEGGGGPPCP